MKESAIFDRLINRMALHSSMVWLACLVEYGGSMIGHFINFNLLKID